MKQRRGQRTENEELLIWLGVLREILHGLDLKLNRTGTLEAEPIEQVGRAAGALYRFGLTARHDLVIANNKRAVLVYPAVMKVLLLGFALPLEPFDICAHVILHRREEAAFDIYTMPEEDFR